jgi:hypothetical protein
MHLPMLGCALGLLPAFAAAQSPLGILNLVDTSFTSRGSTTLPNTNYSAVYDRLDKETYAGWGVDPANPGMRRITGLTGTLQDEIGTTPESFSFVVYTEDPVAPNYPLVAAPLGSVGPLPTPATTVTTAIAWTMTASFATPILAPASSDVFVGAELPQPATGTWPSDGMSCWAMYYVLVASNICDLPGAGHPTTPPEEVGNGGWYVPGQPNGPTYTLNPRQWKIEPLVDGATGVAGTITNQTTAVASNLPPGTSCQASGLYPDARNPPLNAGRVDDIASRWFETGAPAGTPVLFFLGLGNFGTEIPVGAIVPGSSGVLCLDLLRASMIGLGFTGASGEAYYVIGIPPAARASIAGIHLLHQSFALDPVTGVINANGCTRQIL